MQPNILKRFYDDEHTREAVKAFFKETMDELALFKIYNREDVSGLADAEEIVETVFIKLEEEFGSQKHSNLNNEAR